MKAFERQSKINQVSRKIQVNLKQDKCQGGSHDGKEDK
jgi:hypothetical protein